MVQNFVVFMDRSATAKKNHKNFNIELCASLSLATVLMGVWCRQSAGAKFQTTKMSSEGL